jgi:hypothetical protein
MRTWLLVAVGCVGLSAIVRADTLILRDGRRVQGELVAVRGDEIEFEGQRGFFGGRERMRFDRRDVQRIEFDDDRRGIDDRYDDRRDNDRRNDDRDNDRRGRPGGMRERSVNVEAATAWSDTGIEVRAGQTVYIAATGKVRWGPGRQDGPAGEHNSPRNDGRPMPGRPAAALIGRVGDSNDVFFIGDDTGAIRMRSSGRLFLGINDDYLRDNSGSFRVTVYY